MCLSIGFTQESGCLSALLVPVAWSMPEEEETSWVWGRASLERRRFSVDLAVS